MPPNNLNIVDGTKHRGNAPAPTRGLMRAVFRCVDAIGKSDFDRINRYLPAEVDEATALIARKKLDKVLYSLVYAGYLITDHGKWRVAPLSYYEARQQYIEERKAEPKEKRSPRRRTEEVTPITVVRPFFHWAIVTAIGMAAFAMGVAVGIITQ